MSDHLPSKYAILYGRLWKCLNYWELSVCSYSLYISSLIKCVQLMFTCGYVVIVVVVVFR